MAENKINLNGSAISDLGTVSMDLARSDVAVGKYITNSAVLDPLSYTIPTITLEEAFNSDDTNEEWIWVEGYKATNKDMKCRDYQYELGRQYDMPEGSKIKECSSGFHLCLNLKDVFGYYGIGGENRFFKVSALVRKKDNERYGSYGGYLSRMLGNTTDKLAAKSIIFTKELTPDEIFKDTEWAEYDEAFKKIALVTSPVEALKDLKTKKLVSYGYSEPVTKLILDQDERSCSARLYELACALETQPGISMDTKIIALFAY